MNISPALGSSIVFEVQKGAQVQRPRVGSRRLEGSSLPSLTLSFDAESLSFRSSL
jgi:hypothetical protein